MIWPGTQSTYRLKFHFQATETMLEKDQKESLHQLAKEFNLTEIEIVTSIMGLPSLSDSYETIEAIVCITAAVVLDFIT